MSTRSKWIPFELASTRFGDLVEFRPDGVVRLGKVAFADGRRIDNYVFDKNTANRENAFGAILHIRPSDGQELHFRFDGTNWEQLVPDYDAGWPYLYELRKEMAHSGAVIGLLYWAGSNLGKILFVLVYAIIGPIIAIRILFVPMAVEWYAVKFFLVCYLWKALEFWREQVQKRRTKRLPVS